MRIAAAAGSAGRCGRGHHLDRCASAKTIIRALVPEGGHKVRFACYVRYGTSGTSRAGKAGLFSSRKQKWLRRCRPNLKWFEPGHSGRNQPEIMLVALPRFETPGQSDLDPDGKLSVVSGPRNQRHFSRHVVRDHNRPRITCAVFCLCVFSDCCQVVLELGLQRALGRRQADADGCPR